MEEASYALYGANLDPYNESPWRYLIGVLMEQWRVAQREGNSEGIARVTNLIKESIMKIREMKQSLEEQTASEDDGPTGPSASLLSAMVDLLELFTDEKESLSEAKTLCGELMAEDPVRRKYWRNREKVISTHLEKWAS